MKIKLEMIVEYDELSDDERKTLAESIDVSPDELLTAADADIVEFGDAIASWLENSDDEMFAGTELYLQVKQVTCTRVENH